MSRTGNRAGTAGVLEYVKRALPGVAVIFLLAACASGSGTSLPSVPGAASSVPGVTPVTSPAPVTGLHRVHDPGQVTGTLTGPCYYRGTVPGELPDPRCTPGAYDPSVTVAKLCSGTYSTRSYRPPAYQTSRFKYETAYPAYGLPQGTSTELDHLVSLELGGSNDASNLWPEKPASPNGKDAEENRLHAWVCAASGAAAQSRLTRAQRAIAADWVTAERVLGVRTVRASQSPAAVPARTYTAPATHTAAPPPLPVTHSAAPAPAACYPRSGSGNCYRAGEFCPEADLGTSGVAGNGARITCVMSGSRARWE